MGRLKDITGRVAGSELAGLIGGRDGGGGQGRVDRYVYNNGSIRMIGKDGKGGDQSVTGGGDSVGNRTIVELPDIIDIRLLMSSKDELVLPRDLLYTTSDIRPLLVLPISFPLIEYFAIFLFCGFARLIYSNRLSITANWNATIGAVYIICYLVIFIVDWVIFVIRNIKLFNYTIITLLLRVVAGTPALLYLSVLINGFFLYYRMLL